MLTLLAYIDAGQKMYSTLRSHVIRFKQRFSTEVAEALDPEQFLELLREDGFDGVVHIAIVRPPERFSRKPGRVLIVEATAFTKAKRNVVLVVGPGLAVAPNASAEWRVGIESQARIFARFLHANGVGFCANDELGRTFEVLDG